MTNKLKNNIILLLSLCMLLSLTGCTSAAEKNYQAGMDLLEQGRFEEASAQFQELGSYRDASLLLMYSRAALSAENGDYVTACKAFTALGSFLDAPEMLRYYEIREAETAGMNALISENYDTAVTSLMNAAERYEALSLFRDAPQRSEGCLQTLYDQGLTLLQEARYSIACDIYAALGAFRNSGEMSIYCAACLLESEGSYLEAAARFLEISDLLDASTRADTDRDLVYQQALALSEEGRPEAAIPLFSALGQYRDAEVQRASTIQQLFQVRLQSGDYEGALFVLDSYPDAIVLQQTNADEQQRIADFLNDFVQAYLHFSAGTIDSSVGYAGVVPFIERGGALEKRFRQVLIVGSYGHNTFWTSSGWMTAIPLPMSALPPR